MSIAKSISDYLRHSFLSVLLLWACALCGQVVVHDAAPAYLPAPVLADSSETSAESTLHYGEQKASLLAKTRFQNLTLKQLQGTMQLPAFAAPTDEAIPAYAARAPGNNFLSRFFPSSIQTNAP